MHGPGRDSQAGGFAPEDRSQPGIAMNIPARIQLGRRRPAPLRQLSLPFVERGLRRERWFKRLMILTTCLVLALIGRGVPWGRYMTAAVVSSTHLATFRALGVPKPRSEIDDSWRRFRQHGIEVTRPRVDRVYNESDPSTQRLFRYAGVDPEHGLLRWANFDWTLLLPSGVFEADDAGRSYRFRPRTHSIWLRNLPMTPGVLTFYLVPDRPGLADAIRGTTAIPMETSRQTTNSWGLRGPEPDPDAPLRGIVLGDSYMQGMFVGDDETPPECLRHYLQDYLKTRVSILNTGVLGYSTEQYYHSLIAFADRFRPQFVVVSVSSNDFGNLVDVVTRGEGDWREGNYWLEQIIHFCEAHQSRYVIVPAPHQPNMFGRRMSGYYPGALANTLKVQSLMFLDPMDDFINAHLRELIKGEREGARPRGCALFNDDIGDLHFSPAGAKVWAASVGDRLVPLIERDQVLRDQQETSGSGD
jgi:lysophospholipase L1-like esterase